MELDIKEQLSWNQAIAQLNKLKFPTDISTFKISEAISGHKTEGGKKHKVLYYKKKMSPIGDFPVDASYMICETCNPHLLSQKLYLFNNETNMVYIRELM